MFDDFYLEERLFLLFAEANLDDAGIPLLKPEVLAQRAVEYACALRSVQARQNTERK